jgi:hypothetical protein
VLVLIVGWILVLAIAVTIGAGLLAALGVAFDDLGELGDHAVLAVWSGLGLLGALLLLASLVVPLGPGVVVLVAAVLAAAALALGPVRSCWARLARVGPTVLVIGGGVVLVAAGLFTRPVTLFDAGAYHLGIIEWLSRFGSVPGVALLHFRLGLGSGWFALGAAFNHGFLRGHAAGLLGGLAVLLGTGHALVIGERLLLRRRREPADMFALAALVAVLVGLPSDLMISPSPDPAIALVTVEAAILVFRACGRVTAAQRQSLLTGAVVLASAAGSMKLTALPMIAMVLLLALLLRTPATRLLVLVAVTVLLVGPMFASNVVTSGCPLLPSGPCAGVDWAMSSVERERHHDEALDFVRGETRSADRGSVDWVWREWVTSGDVPWSSIAILGVVGAVVVGGWLLLRHRRWWSPPLLVSAVALVATAILARRLPNVLFVAAMLVGVVTVWKARSPGPRVVALMGLAGSAILLVVAPLFRYALADAAMCLAAGLVVVLDRLGVPAHADVPPRPFRITPRGRLAVAAGAVVLTLVTFVAVPGFGTGLAGEPEELVLPPEVPTASVTSERARDFRYRAALVTKQCWLTELPCTDDFVPPDRRLRDPDEGIGAGFVRR